jgi:hypothetical protein
MLVKRPFPARAVDGDGFLTPAELEAMLRAYLIGSAKLASSACDVMPHTVLECQVSTLVNSDTFPRPTTAGLGSDPA